MESRSQVVLAVLVCLLLAAVAYWVFWGNLVPAQTPPKEEAVAKAGLPPVKLSYRAALPTQGQVMGINNTSDTETLNLETVYVRSKKEKEERSYAVAKVIKPKDSVTVGWVELNRWKLQAGDKVRLKFKEYEGLMEAEVE
jgi:hypothetical protein